MIQMNEKLSRCVAMGVKSGCPRDQIVQFVEHAYIPLPWQWKFHAAAREADYADGPVDIGLGGARGPGKSHAVLSQAGLDDCQRISGLKGLFLRQTGSSAKESFDDLVEKVVKGHTAYRRVGNSLKFPNGSRIIFGGFRTENDIDKYIGIEYDFIIIEEANQLSKGKIQKLKGSLRTSKEGWRPRLYTSFNPGGIGHENVKETYITPHRQKTEKDTRFIPSTYKDNPHTNREYREYLEGLEGDLGRAWREGDFDLFAGQYFQEWRQEKHVVRPFTIPDNWKRFRAIDPSGRSGTTSCHWYALDQDGTVWVYREHYGTGRDADEHAKEITRLSEGEQYVYTVIDTAAFAKAGYSETIAEVYSRHGVDGLIPAAKERVTGWNSVHQYLRWDIHTPPKLRVFDNCVNMIRTIPILQHDDLHPEDVDSRGEDHAADELRYFLRTLREQKAPRSLSTVEKRLQEMKERSSGDFNYQYNR